MRLEARCDPTYLQTVVIFLQMLAYDSEPEQDLLGLLEVCQEANMVRGEQSQPIGRRFQETRYR